MQLGFSTSSYASRFVSASLILTPYIVGESLADCKVWQDFGRAWHALGGLDTRWAFFRSSYEAAYGSICLLVLIVLLCPPLLQLGLSCSLRHRSSFSLYFLFFSRSSSTCGSLSISNLCSSVSHELTQFVLPLGQDDLVADCQGYHTWSRNGNKVAYSTLICSSEYISD